METIEKTSWLLIQDRKVLFVRSKGKSIFYTPGGKVEKGESREESLLREMREELSVTLKRTSIRLVFECTGNAHAQTEGVMVHLVCYIAEYNGSLTPTSEIEEMQWFTSMDTAKTTEAGTVVLRWLQKNNLID